MTRIVWIILCTCAIAGCARTTPTAAVDGYETEVSDPQSGVMIRTHIDTDELTTSDRLFVEVELEWAAPVLASFIEPDWSQSGWTLIETHLDPVQSTDDGFVSAVTYLIEPFLPGQYTIPAFGVQIFPDSTFDSVSMESMAMDVRVLSVLDIQDAGDLDPVDGLLDPRATQQIETKSMNLLYGISAFAFGVALLIIWRLTRSRENADASPSVYAQLEHVANGCDESDSVAYHSLYQAFIGLDERLQMTSEVRSMIEQCERARFSLDDANALDPRTMARHTLDLLGAPSGSDA